MKLKTLRTPTSRAISKVFAQMRERKGMTQRQLADFLGRPHSVVGMIETDQRSLKLAEFILIAEALEQDPVKVLKEIVQERG